MPIDPISWAIIIGSFFAGAAVGYFWDEIQEWASQMLGYILDAVNTAIEVTSDAIVYLVKEGSRIYQTMEVFVRNVRTGSTRLESRKQEIPRSKVPDDINAQLEAKMKLKLMQQATYEIISYG